MKLPTAGAGSQETRIRVWDLPTRLFHWGLALSFGAAYVISESERLRQVHVYLGYAVLGLLAFRLAWGFVGTRHARFRSFLFGPGAALGYLRSLAAGAPEQHIGHNPAGSYAVYAILLLGLSVGVSGYCSFNEIGGDRLEELHGLLANAWLVVVCLHVLGVVVGSLVHRQNLARAMVTGYKRAPR